MATIQVPMDWGTWLKSTDMSAPTHGSDSYMEVGIQSIDFQYEARSLIKFNYSGIAGTIQSASLKFYVTAAVVLPTIQVWRITRDSSINATWGSSGLTAWHTPGAENMNNDRYQVPLTDSYLITGPGWHTIPITSLDQLSETLDGLKLILLRPTSGRPATIAKSPAPYLELTYQPVFLGGAQII